MSSESFIESPIPTVEHNYQSPPELDILANVQISEHTTSAEAKSPKSTTTTTNPRPRGRPTIAEMDQRQRELAAKEAFLWEVYKRQEAEMKARQEHEEAEMKARKDKMDAAEAEFKTWMEVQKQQFQPAPVHVEIVDPALSDDVMPDAKATYDELWGNLEDARIILQTLADRMNSFSHAAEMGEQETDRALSGGPNAIPKSEGIALNSFVELRNNVCTLPTSLVIYQQRLEELAKRNHWNRIAKFHIADQETRNVRKAKKQQASRMRAECVQLNEDADYEFYEAKKQKRNQLRML